MLTIARSRSRYGKAAALCAAALLAAACGGGSATTTNSGNGGTGGGTPPPAGGTGSATLSWNAPTQNEDGSPLLDLAGYKIYEGDAPDAGSVTLFDQLDNPGLVMYVADNLSSGTHYFSITAVNGSDVESDYSNFAEVIVN